MHNTKVHHFMHLYTCCTTPTIIFNHCIVSQFEDGFSLQASATVNHDILLQKLDHYGIRGLQLYWFKIYFTGRSQYVCCKGKIILH